MNNLKEYYQKEIIKKMKEKFSLKNDLAVPKIEKIVLNVGTGSKSQAPNFLESAKKSLMTISGQKPIETKAKKAISGFKVKKGQIVGLKVTLRGKKMFDFLNKFINIALPRTRDFKGVESKFDGQGNLTFGIKEHIIFPEIKEGEEPFGLEVTISTTAKKDEEAKELLKLFGIPFK